jgi:hypothetical protein
LIFYMIHNFVLKSKNIEKAFFPFSKGHRSIMSSYINKNEKR